LLFEECDEKLKLQCLQGAGIVVICVKQHGNKNCFSHYFTKCTSFNTGIPLELSICVTYYETWGLSWSKLVLDVGEFDNTIANYGYICTAEELLI
jgi:hypothetical protein